MTYSFTDGYSEEANTALVHRGKTGPSAPLRGAQAPLFAWLEQGTHRQLREGDSKSECTFWGGSSLQRAFKKWGARDGGPLLCERAAGAASPLSIDFVRSSNRTRTRALWGGLWKELIDPFAFPSRSPMSVPFCILLIKLKSLVNQIKVLFF